jgi:hypothetical protein
MVSTKEIEAYFSGPSNPKHLLSFQQDGDGDSDLLRGREVLVLDLNIRWDLDLIDPKKQRSVKMSAEGVPKAS